MIKHTSFTEHIAKYGTYISGRNILTEYIHMLNKTNLGILQKDVDVLILNDWVKYSLTKYSDKSIYHII